jgi:group II intron reverse transcriptase/maturase
LEIAWERVKANQGAGGIDGESIEAFGEGLEERLARLHEELRTDKYIPQPVRQQRIPKAGKPGEWRVLGIPTIYDRVCQQALLNRLEPIFEPIFDDANFGYRRGRSTKDALRKVWKEIEAGGEWIVDADLKDFFGSVVHEKFLTLVAQRVSDGRILRLIEAMLTAGRAQVRKLFHRLDGWLVRRIWSHRHHKWRCCGWQTLPRSQLYGEYGLVNLVAMIPSIATQRATSS